MFFLLENRSMPQKKDVKMMKRKQMKVNVLVLSIVTLFFIGCSKDDDAQPTTETPNEETPIPIANETPIISVQTFTVAEDVADDAVIGTIIATDPEEASLTFELTQNSNDLFEITDQGELSLATGKKLDFETTSSHTLTIEVSDGTHQASAEITITVENVVEPFVTTWKTVTANQAITIRINSELTYDYTIDWGDGTIENNQTNGKVHTYATVGTYVIKISGVFPALRMDAYVASMLLTIEQWGDNEWELMDRMFSGCLNMVSKATDIPNLSKVTRMDNMFFGCSMFNADINNWDVSKVVNMIQMFDGATSFNSDLSQWDVSNVIKMVAMFRNATSFNGDLSQWNVSKVTGLNSMFNGATSFNADLSNWNVSEATNLAGMFNGATSFDGDLSNWNVQKVKYMDNMLDNTNLSIINYDALLTAWSELPNLQSNVSFGVQGLTYCDVGIAGRAHLRNIKNWTISGDQECPR